jgi:hypothetical protein
MCSLHHIFVACVTLGDLELLKPASRQGRVGGGAEQLSHHLEPGVFVRICILCTDI